MAMNRFSGIPCSQSMNGDPFRVKGKAGIIGAKRAKVPFSPVVSTRKIRQESPRTPFLRCAYNGIRPERSPSRIMARSWSLVRPEKYNFSARVDFTSMGKQQSPRRATKSPLPSIPEPAARTTRKGRRETQAIRSFSSCVQLLVTALTPFSVPERTSLSSRS